MTGVGDWVVCVDASPSPFGTAVPLIKGEVYQIEAVHGQLPHGNGEVGLGSFWMDTGLDLVGVPGPAADLCWGAHRFREIEKAATPAKVLVRALALHPQTSSKGEV